MYTTWHWSKDEKDLRLRLFVEWANEKWRYTLGDSTVADVTILVFERLPFCHKSKKLDLNILYQCVLVCSYHNQKILQLLNNVRCGRDARGVTSATHVLIIIISMHLFISYMVWCKFTLPSLHHELRSIAIHSKSNYHYDVKTLWDILMDTECAHAVLGVSLLIINKAMHLSFKSA